MIIFMAGYPSSGKSEFIKRLSGKLGKAKVVIVDPAALRPDEYDNLSDQEQVKARICSWEVASEMLQNTIKDEPNSTIVIYDTCAANINTILPHFTLAKARKHVVFYIFMAATVSECAKRAGDKWPEQRVIDGYARDFSISVPRLRGFSDRFFIIKNRDDAERHELELSAKKVAEAILNNDNARRIRKSEPVRRPAHRTR